MIMQSIFFFHNTFSYSGISVLGLFVFLMAEAHRVVFSKLSPATLKICFLSIKGQQDSYNPSFLQQEGSEANKSQSLGPVSFRFCKMHQLFRRPNPSVL